MNKIKVLKKKRRKTYSHIIFQWFIDTTEKKLTWEIIIWKWKFSFRFIFKRYLARNIWSIIEFTIINISCGKIFSTLWTSKKKFAMDDYCTQIDDFLELRLFWIFILDEIHEERKFHIQKAYAIWNSQIL